MKKIILSIVFLSLSLFNYAQSTVFYEDVFVDKYSNMSDEIRIYATKETDCKTQGKNGFIKIKNVSKTSSDVNLIPFLEIDDAISALQYAQDNLVKENPDNEQFIVFTATTGCSVSVMYSANLLGKKDWKVVFNLAPGTSPSTKAGNLNAIIDNFKKCKGIISDHIEM